LVTATHFVIKSFAGNRSHVLHFHVLRFRPYVGLLKSRQNSNSETYIILTAPVIQRKRHNYTNCKFYRCQELSNILFYITYNTSTLSTSIQ